MTIAKREVAVTSDGRTKRVFGAISTYTDASFNMMDLMDEVYNDDGRLILETKKTYRHEEDELVFDYKYMIQAIDMYNACGEKECAGQVVIELQLVVMPHSLNKATYDKIVSSCGWSADEGWELQAWDVLEYGLGIVMSSETVNLELDEDGEPPYDAIETEDVQDKIKSAIACISGIDMMRGFYLDRAWNMIGTTGWDTLEECVLGKDAIGASLDRINHNSSDEI